MKPIEVIRRLVLDNPHDSMLGEVVRQYIKELDNEEKTIQNEFRRYLCIRKKISIFTLRMFLYGSVFYR